MSAAPTQPPQAPKGTKEELVAYATSEAVAARIEPYTVLAVIECESSWDTHAIGDHGTSFGLAQIHLPAHPEVSRETAEDPHFAIDFLVRNLKEGNGRMWSCYQ